jgi:hypothetical protein
MNEQVAQTLIGERMKELRQRSYPELVALIGRQETRKVVGEDGREYQLETQAFWDSKIGGDVRVMVGADYGGWRAFKPLVDDFIMASDGSFVGESFGSY